MPGSIGGRPNGPARSTARSMAASGPGLAGRRRDRRRPSTSSCRGGAVTVTLPTALMVKATPDGRALAVAADVACGRGCLAASWPWRLSATGPTTLSFSHAAPRLETELRSDDHRRSNAGRRRAEGCRRRRRFCRHLRSVRWPRRSSPSAASSSATSPPISAGRSASPAAGSCCGWAVAIG